MAGIVDRLKGPRGRRWAWALASLVFHAGLLAALVVATEEDGALEATEVEEEVTYVDISSFPPPPPPATAQPEPQPQQPRQPEPQPTQPRPQPTPRPPTPQTPPRATDIVEPADSMPEPEPLGDVAPPPTTQAPVPAGPPAGAVTSTQPGGQPGGVQGGVEGGREGGEVGATGPPEGGTFVAAVVDRKAELRNRRELPRIMERLYPEALKEAGIGGRVVVQFVVEPSGRVDMSSVKIMSADNDALVDATREAIREFRFSPARMGDREVRMLTQMPIVWQVER